MRFIVMFVTAACALFLIKLRWPKKKSIYGRGFTKIKKTGGSKIYQSARRSGYFSILEGGDQKPFAPELFDAESQGSYFLT